MFKEITNKKEASVVNISFSVFGLRNLMFECNKPEIHVYLTNDEEKKEVKIFKLPDLNYVGD